LDRGISHKICAAPFGGAADKILGVAPGLASKNKKKIIAVRSTTDKADANR